MPNTRFVLSLLVGGCLVVGALVGWADEQPPQSGEPSPVDSPAAGSVSVVDDILNETPIVKKLVPVAPPPEKPEQPPVASNETTGPNLGPLMPWEFDKSTMKLPGREFKSPRELLSYLGIDDSSWENVPLETPLDSTDSEMINRLLLRMPKVGDDMLHEVRRTSWTTAEIMSDPRKYQGHAFALEGVVKQIQKTPLSPEQRERFEFTDTYYVTVSLLKQEAEIVVCVPKLPEKWQPKQGPLVVGEPIRANGLFFKPAKTDDGQQRLVFVAEKLRWLPKDQRRQFELTDGSYVLAKYGFDAANFDLLHHRNFRMLGEDERESFYELLDVMKNVPPDEPALREAPTLAIDRCLADPTLMQGEFVNVHGRTMRVEKIVVEDRDIQSRFGIREYYVLYISAPLYDRSIKWARTKDDPEPRVFENFFPVTVCVRELPPGVKPGPNVSELVRVRGAVFKVWAYRPQGAGTDLIQPSPMVIGATAETYTLPKPKNEMANVVFFVVVLGFVVFLWMAIGSMRSSKNLTKRPNEPAPVFTSGESSPKSDSEQATDSTADSSSS